MVYILKWKGIGDFEIEVDYAKGLPHYDLCDKYKKLQWERKRKGRELSEKQQVVLPLTGEKPQEVLDGKPKVKKRKRFTREPKR
jgi:hypothetical protein